MSTPSPEIYIHIRPADAGDVNFIFSAWLRSFRSSAFARQVDGTIYFQEQHKIIEALITTSDLLIACNPEDHSQIYGFLCGGKIDGIDVLHYVYTKHTFRGLGVAKALHKCFMEGDSTKSALYTHDTKSASSISKRYNLIYHPYLLYPTYINNKGEVLSSSDRIKKHSIIERSETTKGDDGQ